MALTRNDLNQIGIIVDNKLEQKLEQKLNPIKKDIRKIKKDIKGIISYFDHDCSQTKVRVKRIEKFIGLTTPTSS